MSIEAMKQGLEALTFDGFTPQDVTHRELTAKAVEALRTAIPQAEAKTDVRCEGCGYMTHHREHMGCVRAAKQFTHPAPGVPDGYVLVPVEPTDEMMAEMLGPFIAPFIAINDDNRSAFIEAYPRMLTAAQAQKGQP